MPAPDPPGPPFIRGEIAARRAPGEIRVTALPPAAYEVPEAIVRRDPQTTVRGPAASSASWESLRPGQRVAVWIRGPAMESLPVQGMADRVVIE